MRRLHRPSEPPPRWLLAARHALLGPRKVSWHACIQAGFSTAINTQGFHAKSAVRHHRPNCALQGTPPPLRASATPNARPWTWALGPRVNAPRAQATRAASSAAVAHSFLPPSLCVGALTAQVQRALDWDIRQRMANAIRKGRRDGTVHLGSCQFSSSHTPGWRLVCGLAARASALLLAPA